MNQQKTERNASKLNYNSTMILAITSFLCISVLLIAPSVQTSNELFGQGVTEEDGIKADVNVLEPRDGIGGHCLPKDTMMFLQSSESPIKSKILTAAIEVDRDYTIISVHDVA
ncbi:MAG: hypothetical protein ACRD8W_05505 [Nitrososphaeraceae archaeon]